MVANQWRTWMTCQNVANMYRALTYPNRATVRIVWRMIMVYYPDLSLESSTPRNLCRSRSISKHVIPIMKLSVNHVRMLYAKPTRLSTALQKAIQHITPADLQSIHCLRYMCKGQ